MSIDTAHLNLCDFLSKRMAGEVSVHPFWHFEPWSVRKRSDEVLAQAKRDGIDLYDAEMSRHVGIDPHPFQDGYLLSTARFRAMLAATQAGKAQPYDAVVYSASGAIKMGDIKIGDRVFGSDGELHDVVGIYEQGLRDVWSVETESGCRTECDIEHLWVFRPPRREEKGRLVWYHGACHENPKWDSTYVLPLSEIIKRYGLIQQKGNSWSIPITRKVQFAERAHVIPPYSLGVLLGDGNYTAKATAFTCSNESLDLIERVRNEIGILSQTKTSKYKTVPTYFVSRRRGAVRVELDRMGLGGKKSEDKFIPSEYLLDSARHRLDLLRGLMDTDGTCGKKRGCNMEFYSKSKLLADGVVWLVRSLGGRAKVRLKDTHYIKNGRRVDCGICHRVKIWMSEDNPFFTHRKASLWYPIRYRNLNRVSEVKYVGKKPCRCIMVDSSEHTYLTDDFLVTHNSYPAIIELGIMVSGEKPLSLRFPKGYDTKVPRVISSENVRRFGRFDSKTYQFIDHDDKAPLPKTWDEWNCGTIHGAGVYPDEKLAPPGAVIWIGTTHKALWEMWWPKLTDKAHSIFPAEFLDTTRGLGGFSKAEWTVHCLRDTRITIISYESDPKSFEAITTHACVFDEEAQQKACVTAAVNHTRFFSMVMTPYNGMTYTKKLMFDDGKDFSQNNVFHATSYDSPYLTADEIKHRRSLMEQWEIGARIWGLHTEVKGKPYYDRSKINAWIRRFKTPFTWGRFEPRAEFDGIITRPERGKPGLMGTQVTLEECAGDNQCDSWRIYEKRSDEYAYYLMADSAEGSDIPSEAGDVLASLVMRPPDKAKGERFPQIVASLRSTMKTANFARVCSYALRHYNNALLCAEGPTRGSYNALFYAELSEYPFWFLQTSMRDSTRKVRSVKGFDTNAATRHALFDGIREVLDEYDENTQPEIRDEPLLIELAGCIISPSKGINRPDHTDASTLDTTICYGQGIYIWRHYPDQIKNRASRIEDEGFLAKFMRFHNIKPPGGKQPVYLGEGVETFR